MNLISKIRDAWGWIGIDPIEVVGENDFGNLIVRDVDDQYWRICPEDVYCKVIAESREKLTELSNDQEFLADWKMTALVKQAKQSIGPLADRQKYCLAIPSILGGAYEAANLKSISLIELIEFSGYIGEQLHDLPDGSKIELTVVG